MFKVPCYRPATRTVAPGRKVTQDMATQLLEDDDTMRAPRDESLRVSAPRAVPTVPNTAAKQPVTSEYHNRSQITDSEDQKEDDDDV